VWIEVLEPQRKPAGAAARRWASRAKSNAPHSIINKRFNPLISIVGSTATRTFTVTFTVNWPSTSIGAGLRAVLQKPTFRDLSTSIDSRDDSQRHRHAFVSVGEGPKQRGHQTP